MSTAISEAIRPSRLSVKLCEALSGEEDTFVRLAALKACIAIEDELLQASMFKSSMMGTVEGGYDS